MMVVMKILQLIAALSILVLVHELGHLFFAKLFKIRVEKFYLFFDVGKFSLFKYKPKGSDTTYGIGWLPFGGYCKICGMVDESLDMAAMKETPKAWEFRSKPAWQRFLVMFGGVLFNFILAIILFCSTLYVWGEDYIKTSDAIYGISASELAKDVGFKDGDMIISFDGVAVNNFATLQMTLAMNRSKEAEVIRAGERVSIRIDEQYMPAIINTPRMFEICVPFQINSISPESANRDRGLLSGDRICQIDTISVFSIESVVTALQGYKNRDVNVKILRNGNYLEKSLYVNENGQIGVITEGDLSKFFKITKNRYSLLSSIPAGISKGYNSIKGYLKQLGLIFNPKTEAYKSVGSFIAIGSIFPGAWIWQAFWSITALLSIMLAVVNLLPIPALDGGHILFLIYEMITGKRPSDKFLEVTQIIGMFILFGLMFFACGNDIYRLLR